MVVRTKPLPFIEWWRVENTGWSNGISWFDISSSRTNPTRFETESDAIKYINDHKDPEQETQWRYVHVTLEREDNRSVTTEVWTEL